MNSLRSARPRPQRDHHDLGRPLDAVDRDAADRAVGPIERQSVDHAGDQLGPALDRRLEGGPGEPQRVHLGGRLVAADHLVGHHVAVEPVRARQAPVPLEVALVGRRGHECVHGAVAEPLGAELVGQLAVQAEARPRELVEGRARVPVEGEEAGGLAGRRRPRPDPVDDQRPRSAPGQEEGDRRSDGPRPADDDPGLIARRHPRDRTPVTSRRAEGVGFGPTPRRPPGSGFQDRGGKRRSPCKAAPSASSGPPSESERPQERAGVGGHCEGASASADRPGRSSTGSI